MFLWRRHRPSSTLAVRACDRLQLLHAVVGVRGVPCVRITQRARGKRSLSTRACHSPLSLSLTLSHFLCVCVCVCVHVCVCVCVWRKRDVPPLSCRYNNSSDIFEDFDFPGATSVDIVFDSQCVTENNYDFLRFLKSRASNDDCYGDSKSVSPPPFY